MIQAPETVVLLVIPLATWSFFWMTLGLWFSARNGDKSWFIFFLLVHLLGVPELIYLRMHRFWPFKHKEKT